MFHLITNKRLRLLRLTPDEQMRLMDHASLTRLLCVGARWADGCAVVAQAGARDGTGAILLQLYHDRFEVVAEGAVIPPIALSEVTPELGAPPWAPIPGVTERADPLPSAGAT